MFAFILILVSIFLLCYAIFLCAKMINVFDRAIHKRAGRIMLSLIIIFFIGNIVYLVFNYNLMFSNFLIAILLLFTAFFIMLVLHVNHSLIIRLTMKNLELKEFSEKLLAEAQARTSNKERVENIKSIIEDKDRELEMNLENSSASKLELPKIEESEDAQAEKLNDNEGK